MTTAMIEVLSGASSGASTTPVMAGSNYVGPLPPAGYPLVIPVAEIDFWSTKGLADEADADADYRAGNVRRFRTGGDAAADLFRHDV